MKLKKTRILALILLLLANVYVWRFIFKVSEGDNLVVIFFDVGQGDAIFIETPEGHQILIDGGPSEKKILEKLAKVIPFWDKEIDLVVLTHPDADHLTGLNAVLQRYRVENIVWTGFQKETETFRQWERNVEEERKEGARVFLMRRGERIKAGRAEFLVFYPFQGFKEEFAGRESNDSSLVLKLIFGNKKFLFPGDISKKVEFWLLTATDFPEDLSADVLKIPHHGSRNSSSREFLLSVNPQFAVIFCGKNNQFGFPSGEVLQALGDFGINILRTDEDGEIKFISDGKKLAVEKIR